MSYSNPAAFYAQPTAGQTVNIPSFDGPAGMAFIDPAGLLATLTINFPAAFDGQMLTVASSKAITLLSLSSSVGAILGAITTLALNGSMTYAWSVATSQWFKV